MQKRQACGDNLAVALSALCMLHCLTPVLVLLLPSLTSLLAFHDETFHAGLLFIIIPVGLLALCSGYRHHLQRRWLSVGIAGLTVLALPVVLGHERIPEQTETIITITGSLLIVCAHIQNLRLARETDCAENHSRHEHSVPSYKRNIT
ncbi:MerC domain-containing protein [Salinimonas lutimaris]|uniref:MerC domain-containing protein n=1 Tax=Salinimonas lutimaris TaxID=914153 RepID=UPI0010C05A5A|nr:MerC domain-containing protein [Salinimonas lutimaris]